MVLAVLVAAACGAPLSAESLPPPLGLLPLTVEPGNPARGRVLVRDMTKATCLICHELPIPEEPDHGQIGPSLADVGSRLTPAELRLRLVDPKAVNPDTIMPSYYQLEGLYRVADEYRDKPIYTAQQIEDVVAYLSQLTGPIP